MMEPPRAPDSGMSPYQDPHSWLPHPWIEPGAQLPPSPRRPPGPEREPGTGKRFSDDEVDAARVRPFIVTGGRTQALYEGLRIESLLLAKPGALSAPLQFEQRQMVELTQRAISLAEVAAALSVPLGVARVLASDLYYENLIRVLEPHQLSVFDIERIRDLVRAL